MSTYTFEEIKEFKNDCMDLLESAEKALLDLDKGADFKTSFDTVFRCFHNLKGSAGVMEMDKLQKHTHELETILMQASANGELSKNCIEFFLKGIDAAKSILEGHDVEFSFSVCESNVEQSDASDVTAAPIVSVVTDMDPALAEFFAECSEILERVSSNLQQIESGSKEKSVIDGLYREVHSLKGAAYLFSYRQIGDVAHHLESSLEGVRDGKEVATPELINMLFKGLDLSEKLVRLAKSGEKLEKYEKEVEQFTHQLVQPVSTQTLKTEISAVSPTTPAAEAPVMASAAAGGNVPPASDDAKSSANKQADDSNSSIRVSVSLLDNLMTLMGEMVLVRNQILQYANQSDDLEFLSVGKKLNVVTSEIQEEMMKTRMQPIGNTLNKFNRVVRDLSNELKKSIQLHIEGAETELDKSLLEAIKDPLTHIVRNSCDHGIEIPDLRRQKGKPEKGNVYVKAYHEGGQVVVEVQDDGKGLHKDMIINKAVEKRNHRQSKSH